MPVGDVFHDRQTQSGAAHRTGAAFIHAVKSFRQAGNVLSGYANPFIRHRQNNPRPRGKPRFDGLAAAR